MAGGVLSALWTMMRHPKQRTTGLPGLKKNIRRMYSRQVPDRVLRGVSRTVSGIIKKRAR